MAWARHSICESALTGGRATMLEFPEGEKTSVTATASYPFFHLPVSQYHGLSPGRQSLQERQHTCKVVLKRVRATVLPWGSSKYDIFWVCVCSLSYPACKAHAPYYILICGLCGCTIFFHIILKIAWFFGGKKLSIMYVFWFSVQFCWKNFLF